MTVSQSVTGKLARIIQICARSAASSLVITATHIGASTRGYQELPVPLAIPTTAEQAAAKAVCLCIASAQRYRPHISVEVVSHSMWVPATAG
jgi:hypothetical protein